MTLIGRYIFLIKEQLLNALLPMLVTLFDIVIEVNPLQPKNAELPMLVTPSGIVIDVNSLQPENAELPILVTPFGITPEQLNP